MPMPFYMTMTGTTQSAIEGSCDQSGREGTILCQAFQHDISIPRDPQSGQPTGLRVPDRRRKRAPVVSGPQYMTGFHNASPGLFSYENPCY